jgi:hypothetical protein
VEVLGEKKKEGEIKRERKEGPKKQRKGIYKRKEITV